MALATLARSSRAEFGCVERLDSQLRHFGVSTTLDRFPPYWRASAVPLVAGTRVKTPDTGSVNTLCSHISLRRNRLRVTRCALAAPL